MLLKADGVDGSRSRHQSAKAWKRSSNHERREPPAMEITTSRYFNPPTTQYARQITLTRYRQSQSQSQRLQQSALALQSLRSYALLLKHFGLSLEPHVQGY